MKYEFDVIGPVTGKGRPRVNTYTARAYTPAKTKEYEDLVKQYFIIKYPNLAFISASFSNSFMILIII